MSTGATWLFGIAFTIFIALAVAAGIDEHKRWEAFKVAQNCKVVGSMDGEVFNTYGVGANGQMTIGIGSTGKKTGWKCDDGMTYWKGD